MRLLKNQSETGKGTQMLRKIKTFLQSEEGPTAVEYAVMLALIIAVCLVAIESVGQSTANTFNDSAREIDNFLN